MYDYFIPSEDELLIFYIFMQGVKIHATGRKKNLIYLERLLYMLVMEDN